MKFEQIYKKNNINLYYTSYLGERDGYKKKSKAVGQQGWEQINPWISFRPYLKWLSPRVQSTTAPNKEAPNAWLIASPSIYRCVLLSRRSIDYIYLSSIDQLPSFWLDKKVKSLRTSANQLLLNTPYIKQIKSIMNIYQSNHT